MLSALRWLRPDGQMVSILTRPYGRMLSTNIFPIGDRLPVVSILTRPYGRMLSAWVPAGPTLLGGFNPHPPLRADALSEAVRDLIIGGIVSILTRPYGRMLSRRERLRA